MLGMRANSQDELYAWTLLGRDCEPSPERDFAPKND